MAKIEQDNRVLAELDKSRATISKLKTDVFPPSRHFIPVLLLLLLRRRLLLFPFTCYSFALDPAIRLFIAAKKTRRRSCLCVCLSLSLSVKLIR